MELLEKIDESLNLFETIKLDNFTIENNTQIIKNYSNIIKTNIIFVKQCIKSYSDNTEHYVNVLKNLKNNVEIAYIILKYKKINLNIVVDNIITMSNNKLNCKIFNFTLWFICSKQILDDNNINNKDKIEKILSLSECIIDIIDEIF